MRERLSRVRHKLQDYWRNLMHSRFTCISRGSAEIKKLMTWGHKDNWRRKEHKK